MSYQSYVLQFINNYNVVKLILIHLCIANISGTYAPKLTYRQPAQNGVLMDQRCRAIYCIQLSIMPMQIAITIT